MRNLKNLKAFFISSGTLTGSLARAACASGTRQCSTTASWPTSGSSLGHRNRLLIFYSSSHLMYSLESLLSHLGLNDFTCFSKLKLGNSYFGRGGAFLSFYSLYNVKWSSFTVCLCGRNFSGVFLRTSTSLPPGARSSTPCSTADSRRRKRSSCLTSIQVHEPL